MAESPWETPAYRRVMTARAEGDALIVRFGDGAEVSVDKRRLVPSTSEGVDWENIKVDRFEITVHEHVRGGKTVRAHKRQRPEKDPTLFPDETPGPACNGTWAELYR